MRFLGVKKELSAAELRYFTDVDHHDHGRAGLDLRRIREDSSPVVRFVVRDAVRSDQGAAPDGPSSLVGHGRIRRADADKLAGEKEAVVARVQGAEHERGVADPGVPPGGVVQPDSRAAQSESSSTDRRQALRIRKVIDSM